MKRKEEEIKYLADNEVSNTIKNMKSETDNFLREHIKKLKSDYEEKLENFKKS